MVKVMNKGKIVILMLLIVSILGIIAIPIKAQAASETKGYLVLVEEKDGSWNSYDNYVEIKQDKVLMVRVNDIAKAIGVTYKKNDKKTVTISNGKKRNVYTLGVVKYKYSSKSKTVTKKTAYNPYTSETDNSVMVEYNSLATLVYVKCFDTANAGDYISAGYQGVICFSRYNKITKLPELEKGIRVTTEKEFLKAATDINTTIINITADIIITEDFTYEREDKPVTINIKKGKTLTINKSLIGVGGSISNNGTIVVNGTFDRGICNLINNGTVIVNREGTLQSGMSDLNNNGSLTVANGANLNIVRGSVFNNAGELINEGTIQINDGGNLNDKGGKITNNGTIDLYSYYSGDISLIAGTGILNDHREAVTE